MTCLRRTRSSLFCHFLRDSCSHCCIVSQASGDMSLGSGSPRGKEDEEGDDVGDGVLVDRAFLGGEAFGEGGEGGGSGGSGLLRFGFTLVDLA